MKQTAGFKHANLSLQTPDACLTDWSHYCEAATEPLCWLSVLSSFFSCHGYPKILIIIIKLNIYIASLKLVAEVQCL